MKKSLLPTLLAVVVFSSCSTAYKTGSTPDDVYYSPGSSIKVAGVDNRYDDYTANGDDNYLRMKVQNRYQWDAIDDYNYWNDSRYDFGYTCFPSRSVLLNPYNPYSAWSYGFYYSPWASFYSPYYTIVYYKNPRTYYGNTSKTNLTAYRNGNYYYNSNINKQSFGSLLKSAFSSNNANYNYNTNNSTNPSRSFNSGFTPNNSAGGRSGGFSSSATSGGTRVSRSPR